MARQDYYTQLEQRGAKPRTASNTTSNPSSFNPAFTTGQGMNEADVSQNQNQGVTSMDNYDSSNYKKGWGIGYNDKDISGASAGNHVDWGNQDQLRTERERVNSVMGNRTKYGQANDGYADYLGQLESRIKPEPTEQVDFDKYKTENATIEDLTSKYGFDFSREGAKTQAEAERQARADGIDNQERQADSNLESAAEGLDRNYFQQALQQQQAQTNSGLNAGIASDQDLRMSMSRQAEMGDMYRDRNLTMSDLNSQRGRLDQEALAREYALHFERAQQGFENAMTLDQGNRQENQALMNAALQQRGMNLDEEQFDRNFSLEEGITQGNYLTEGQQGIFNDIAELKRIAENTNDPLEAREASRQADQIRQRAIAEGVDPSLIGSDVTAEQMVENMQEFGQTQQARESDRAMTEQERSARVGERVQDAQLDETIRSNKSREDLARDQFEKPYNDLTAQQQGQLDLQWAQQELAYERFDRPYDQLTYYEQSMIDRDYAQMEQSRGASGGYNSYDPYNTGGAGTFPLPPGSSSSIGNVVKKYESGSSGAGTIANNPGDIGGASYGTYQIATNTGTMKNFLNWLGRTNPSMRGSLSGNPGSNSFNNAWKSLARSRESEFDSMQNQFIKETHFKPAVAKIKKSTGVDMSKQHPAVQEAIWSTAIQHGTGGANSVVRNAGIRNGMSPQQMINALYNERSKVNKYFKSSSQSVKNSVANRFKNERNDIMKML